MTFLAIFIESILSKFDEVIVCCQCNFDFALLLEKARDRRVDVLIFRYLIRMGWKGARPGLFYTYKIFPILFLSVTDCRLGSAVHFEAIWVVNDAEWCLYMRSDFHQSIHLLEFMCIHQNRYEGGT